jgi:hypothetical protein
VTPSGVEPATIRFVAQCLNHHMPPEKYVDRLEMYIGNGMGSNSSNDKDNYNFKVSSVPCTYFIIEHGLLLQVEIFQSVVHQLTRICPH